jgi:beta-N-acetylhexosaminidase
MTKHVLVLFLFCSVFVSAQQSNPAETYFSKDLALDEKVDSLFLTLSLSERVGQLIMPAVGRYGTTADTIEMLLKEKKIGGVLLLNGTKQEFSDWTARFNGLNEQIGALPFLYSADAEPSLVNRKMKGSTEVKKAVEITSIQEVQEVAQIISDDLNAVGVNYNFAPVVDVSKNATVGYRGFGSDPKNIIPFSAAFIRVTQNNNIIATAKHFPGHGLVSGDTHKALQVIDGELKELENYPPLIADSVLSIMIAHIAVKNNPMYSTDGMPATTSRKIVTELLRDSLGFDGLIVTDAMNMGGVVNVKQAYSKAIAAGCDILLMPVNSFKAHSEILEKYSSDEAFRTGVDESVKRIIRMKLALGLI